MGIHRYFKTEDLFPQWFSAFDVSDPEDFFVEFPTSTSAPTNFGNMSTDELRAVAESVVCFWRWLTFIAYMPQDETQADGSIGYKPGDALRIRKDLRTRSRRIFSFDIWEEIAPSLREDVEEATIKTWSGAVPTDADHVLMGKFDQLSPPIDMQMRQISQLFNYALAVGQVVQPQMFRVVCESAPPLPLQDADRNERRTADRRARKAASRHARNMSNEWQTTQCARPVLAPRQAKITPAQAAQITITSHTIFADSAAAADTNEMKRSRIIDLSKILKRPGLPCLVWSDGLQSYIIIPDYGQLWYEALIFADANRVRADAINLLLDAAHSGQATLSQAHLDALKLFYTKTATSIEAGSADIGMIKIFQAVFSVTKL
ncbi:hypothetical protein LTR66_017947 [Elasticomyces elasticus]|nr:hypothetical protein LTR66_017947 [Elasticomyces elasticus]